MRRPVGIGLVVISAASFGTLAIFGQYAYADGMDAFTILFLRFTLAALGMFSLLCLRGQPLPPRAALPRLVGMGAIGYVGQAFCYLTALKYASSGLVALLLYLYPVFVTGLSALVLRERITRDKLAALGVALAGLALTVGPAGGQVLGAALAVSAALIYSVYIIVGAQVMRQVSAVQSSVVIFASAGLMSGLLMLLSGPHLPRSLAGWGAMAAIVLVATMLAVTTFLAGLERVGPSSASMLSILEPVVTVLLAAWLLGDRLKPLTLLGGALILAGVLLLARAELGGRPKTNDQGRASQEP